MRLRLIVIAGPTACGKTRLGVAVAHALGSQIVSADSRQVYRGLDIGSGKDLAEYRAVRPPVPVHLIDVADPREVYTLYHYKRDCARLLRGFASREPWSDGGRPLVMVGGSGLYIEAVLRDYRIANVPEDQALREQLMRLDRDALDARLRVEDPERWSRTDLSSRKRIVRALEIAAWSRERTVEESDPLGVELEHRVFVVEVDRKLVHRRIERRLDERLAEGMIDEVRNLLDAGISPARLEMLGLEYREVGAHLAGRKTLAEMREDLAREIRRFAKRQETWFRGMERRGLQVRRIAPGDVATVLAAF